MQARQRRLEKLARLLDASIRVPGTSFRVGADGLIGLIPGIGDAATAAISLYLIAEAQQMGARKTTLFKMMWNAGIDAVLGAIPILGDLFDFAHKANLKNVRLLEREMERQGAIVPPSPQTPSAAPLTRS